MENENPTGEANLLQQIESNEKLETIGKNTEASLLVQDETKEAVKDLQPALEAIMVNTEPKEVQKVKIEIEEDEKEELASAFFSMLKGKKGDQGEDGKTPTKEELIEIIEPLIPEPIKGEDGKDYILTEKDKKEIVSKIKVPVVEKVIERTETIIEKPVNIDKTKTVVKEVAKYETAKEIAKKLNSLVKEIDFKVIKNFPDFSRNSPNNGGNGIGYIREASDVNLNTAPTDGQALIWDDAGYWKAGDVATSGVTSVAMTVPTGLAVAGSPITTSGTLAVTLASGYVIPTQANLDLKASLAQYKNLWIPANAMTPRVTNGALGATEEYTTNDIMQEYYLFDSTTEEGVQFTVNMPDDWNLGTIKYKIYWDASTGASASDTVSWGMKAGALSNDDAIDQALGTQVVVNDVVIAVGDLHISPASGALTVGGTPALGDMCVFQVVRNVAGTDDMTEDAKLLGVSIQYLTNTVATIQW